MQGTRMRGRARCGALVVLLVASVLVACKAPAPATEVSPDDTAGFAALDKTPIKVRFQAETTCPFEKSKKLKTAIKIECGTVRVPQDRDKPRKEQVDLSVAVIRSPNKDKQPDPIVYLEGGPGGSAVADIEHWVSPPTSLLDDRDVILIDQRGTGYSSPRLWCDFEFKSLPDDTPEDEALGKCVDRLQRAKIDFTKFGTKDAAADVDSVRQALGIDKWNVFGVSYGTRLALRYMHDFPDGIRSVVLDSTYPAGTSLGDAPLDAGRAVRNVLQACQADAGCAARNPNIEARFYRTIDKYNQQPLQVRVFDLDRNRPVTKVFTGDDFVEAIFQTMYRTSAIPNVPAAVAAADNGSMIEALRTLDRDLIERESTGDEQGPEDASARPLLSDGLYLTVECREDFPFADWEAVKASTGELNPSLAAAELKTTEKTFHRCAAWPHDDPEQNPVTDADIPTLVMAGSFDPITPAAWGQLAASTLPKATVLLFNGAGHGTYVAGDCPLAKLKTFIGDPVNGPGPACDLPPVQFR